jgi:hypothetical protein
MSMMKTDTSKEELMAMVDFVAPTYFLGYGSLMYPDGINTRGMHKYYTNEDLMPVTLTGFKRSFCALFKDLAFYGIYKDAGSELNGIMFEIESLHDYTMLLMAEAAHPIYKPMMYNLLDVRDQVAMYPGNVLGDGRVMVLESREIDEESGYIPKYYVSDVYDGIQRWGQEFSLEFLRTGGQAPKGPFDIEVLSPWTQGRTIACARRR